MQAVPFTDTNKGILNLGVICTVYLPRDEMKTSPNEDGGKAFKMLLEHFLKLTPRLIIEEVRCMDDIDEMLGFGNRAKLLLRITFPLPPRERNRTHLINVLREVVVAAHIEFIDFDDGDGSMIRVFAHDDCD
jgi:hypothetical protein